MIFKNKNIIIMPSYTTVIFSFQKEDPFSLTCGHEVKANTTRGLDFEHMIKREHTREG
jgi:hypothetical protein